MKSRLPLSATKMIVLVLIASTVSGCPASIRKPRIRERADGYFKAGEYDKAKIEYMNLLRLDNQDVTAYERIGSMWVDEGAPLRAIPFFLKVRELAPNNVESRAKLALAFMALGGMKEARNEALEVLKRDPGNLDAIVIVADTGQTDEDIAVTEEVLNKFPDHNASAFHVASARLALRKGELGEAADDLQQALTADPKSARVHLAMAYVYLMRKDMDRAGEEFKTAADLSLIRSGERLKYTEYLVSKGAKDEARKSLQGITAKAPDYLPAWTVLARLAADEKKYDDSLSFLENIFSRDPNNADARILQSEVLLAKGDSKGAIAVLDKLNNAYPDNAVVKYQLARTYLGAKNVSQAISVLQQAIAIRPDYVEAIQTLAELNIRTGKPQAAITPMEDLVKKRPDLPIPRKLLAGAYISLGRTDDAANLYREQIQRLPESPEPYFLLGVILRQQKKRDEARQAFEKAAQLAPNELSSVDQLVELDLLDKKFDSAMQRVQQELSKSPQKAYVHVMEGKVYAEQHDWTHAEEALRKAIELDPNQVVAYNLLVSVYVVSNKLPQALTELQGMLEKNPNNTAAITMTGLIYDKMKEYEKERDAYEKLLAINSDSVLALNNLAYLYADRLNQLDRAYDLAQKARNLQPTDGSIADTLGWIFYKRADYQQALPLLQESASKLPDDPQVRFHLAMTYYMMNQMDAAKAAFQKSIASPTDFPDKAEAQRRLAQIADPSGQPVDRPIAETEALVKQQPNDPILISRLADAYEKQGDAAKAAASYEQALKLNGRLPGVALKLAQLYAGPLHDREKALDYAKKARELAPNDTHTAGILGRIAFQAGNLSWSYSLLQESARRGGDDPAVLHDLALAAYGLGKVNEARQMMQRSLDATPDKAAAEDAKRFLAMTALDQVAPETAAAEPEIQKALQADPDYVPALMAEAAVKLQNNDPKGASDLYSKVLQKYPDFAPAEKRLAGIYANDPNELAKANDLAMKARKTLADDPELAQTLAEINFARKQYPYAIQLFQQSSAKRPLSAKDLFELGVAQIETKQEAKGRENLEKALAAGLKDPMAQEAKRHLATPQQLKENP